MTTNRLAGRPRKQIVDGKQECCICKEWKPLGDFYPSKVTKSGYETRCNKCTCARVRKYLNDDTKLYLVSLCKAHKSFAKRSGRQRRVGLAERSELTPEILLEIWNEQCGKCAITLVPMTHIRGAGYKILTNVSIDRIDSGGEYVRGNVRLVCKSVNWMKNAMTDRELVQWAALILNGPLAKNH